MSFRLLSKITGQKAKDIGNAVTDAVVAFDPEAATEASIDMMDEQVDALSLEVEKARQEFNREKQEADAVRETYNKYFAAAQALEIQLDDETLSAKKTKELDASLSSLVVKLEELMAEVEVETAEADEAEEILNQIEESLQSAVTVLKTARKTHESAIRKMKKAKTASDRADANADRANRLAGINSPSNNNMERALNAMQKTTDESNAQANAKNRKAEMIMPTGVTEDKNIAAALAAVDGTAEKASQSASTRLSSLKKL